MPPRRLTKVQRAYRTTGGTLTAGATVQTLTYDGLGRRITKAVDNCGDWDATLHTYLDGQRMIELRDGSDDVLKQYVWGTQYVDELVQIGINVAYTTTDDCEHFFWALQDAHYNVLAVIGGIDGRLVERYEFTPYGRRTVFSHGWLSADLDDDGDVDDDDLGILSGNWGQSVDSVTDGDINGDGQVSGADLGIHGGQYGMDVAAADDALVTHPRLGSYRGDSLFGLALCDVGHQGLLHDAATGLLNNRARMLNPRINQMNQPDPMWYPDGMNLYESASSSPTTQVDPLGLRAYRLGWGNPQIRNDEGAGEWDSKGWTPKMLAVKVALKKVVLPKVRLEWPNAAAHLEYYLGNNGGAAYRMNLRGMLRDVPSARELYRTELREAMVFVEKNLKTEGTYKITSGLESDGSNRKAESKDWFYAVGGYDAWGKGTVTVKCPKGDSEYTLQFKYIVEDRYNWDTGKSVTIGLITVTDHFMGEWHRQGLAREFQLIGIETVTIRWKKGEIDKVVADPGSLPTGGQGGRRGGGR